MLHGPEISLENYCCFSMSGMPQSSSCIITICNQQEIYRFLVLGRNARFSFYPTYKSTLES